MGWVRQRETQVLSAGAFLTTADFQFLALTYKETSLEKSSSISAQQGCLNNSVTGKMAIILKKRETFCTSDFKDVLLWIRKTNFWHEKTKALYLILLKQNAICISERLNCPLMLPIEAWTLTFILSFSTRIYWRLLFFMK